MAEGDFKPRVARSARFLSRSQLDGGGRLQASRRSLRSLSYRSQLGCGGECTRASKNATPKQGLTRSESTEMLQESSERGTRASKNATPKQARSRGNKRAKRADHAHQAKKRAQRARHTRKEKRDTETGSDTKREYREQRARHTRKEKRDTETGSEKKRAQRARHTHKEKSERSERIVFCSFSHGKGAGSPG